MTRRDDADHLRAVNKELFEIIAAKDRLLSERDSKIRYLTAERDYWRGEYKHITRELEERKWPVMTTNPPSPSCARPSPQR